MIDLRHVEEYIDKQINSVKADTHKTLLDALNVIKSLIESYKKSESAHYLLEIRRFIESIKLVSLSHSDSFFRRKNENARFMGDILFAKKHFSIISSPDEREQICQRNNMPNLLLSASTEGIFGWIYQTISQKLPVSAIEWEASFAKDELNGITCSEINDWQSDMQEIETPLKAVRDFRRDIKILGTNPAQFDSDEDAIEKLQSLIDQSTYTDEEKMHLKAWMLAKAGQEMNFFITDMINKQSLFKIPETMLSQQHENDLSTRSFATDNNWSLDKEGKIIYHQNMHVRQILNGSDCILARNPNGDVSVIRSNEPEYESALLQKSQHGSNCLVSISSHAKLTVNHGKIKPVILSLNVTSQTSMISPPVNSRPAAAAAATLDSPYDLDRPHSAKF